VYLVGSEEGRIYRCSTEYDSEHLDVYMGHDQSVYSVKWNFYHPDVFLAASEDWNLSVGHSNLEEGLFYFLNLTHR